MKEEAARAAEADRMREVEKYKEGVRYQQELERQLEVMINQMSGKSLKCVNSIVFFVSKRR